MKRLIILLLIVVHSQLLGADGYYISPGIQIGINSSKEYFFSYQATFGLYEDYGFSAYMCWKESGMHVYTWTKTDDRPFFFSIDIYTCKDFDIKDVINFTSKSFEDVITNLTWRE